MKKLTNLKIRLIAFTSIILILLVGIIITNQPHSNAVPTTLVNLEYDKTQYEYLSNIPYETSSYVGYGDIYLDRNNEGQRISVRINGSPVSFLKGVSAHATSDLVYNLEGYNYDLFTAYLGVDASRNDLGNGVKFFIYTSVDGENWELKTSENPSIMKGNDNAEYVSIELKGAKYLRLHCNSNGSNAQDHAVYANARLVSENYTPTNHNIKPVSAYDETLKGLSTNQIINDNELTLLQREFVSRVGYDQLKILMDYDPDFTKTINWLLNDLTSLKLYITGGDPVGSYAESLNVLTTLYEKYSGDLSSTNPNRDLHRKMMITLSLTHSTKVCLWINGTDCSDALTRYEIYKELYNASRLENELFASLSIEEMRYVFNNNIDDEEIKWLNNHARKYPTNNLPYNLDSYNYIKYTFGYDYYKSTYYDIANYNTWNNKYDLANYNITYQENHPRLWIVFEEGAVCGGISKTGSNLNGVFGIPSAVIGQPGHAAYLVYSKDKNNNGLWHIYNDISGWSQSEKSERMPNGWGSSNWDSYYQVSYILLSQAALNDLPNYERSEEIILTTKLYSNNQTKLESIYREALQVQSINLDAWYGLINTYKANPTKTETDYLNLASEIATNLTYYPLPMWDLLNLIKPNLTTPESIVKFNLLLDDTLKKSSNATTNDTLQPDATKVMADYLLKQNDLSIASFSFDGENKKTIVISDKITSSNFTYEYSLDNGATWVATQQRHQVLVDDEIAKINATDDIKIRLIGSSDIFAIDITEGTLPTNLYANDLENKLFGSTSNVEWSIDNGATWTMFQDHNPVLSSSKTLIVRTAKTGTTTSSPTATYNFTKDATDLTQSYISIEHLQIASVSSEETNKNNQATHAIDGNIHNIWHTRWDGQDQEKYITIKLDKNYYLSALQYVPRQDASNGRITNAKIFVSLDNQTWQEVVGNTTWANDAQSKLVTFAPTKAMYIKISAIESIGDYASAAMINLFQDLTQLVPPTAQIEYSTTSLTNQNVTVKLVNPSEKITITNNGGSDTYTFKENGTFTFKFADEDGLQGTAVATVNWIDKIKPTAAILVTTSKLTNKNVTAMLIEYSENIIITNNEGQSTYTFFKNGEFTFEFQDAAGNKNDATIIVDWIDKTIPTAKIAYSTTTQTTGEVTAKLIDPSEKIAILNNQGNNTYTFKENGTFAFAYKDEAGNIGLTVAKVDWIITPSEEPKPNTPTKPTPSKPSKPSQTKPSQTTPSQTKPSTGSSESQEDPKSAYYFTNQNISLKAYVTSENLIFNKEVLPLDETLTTNIEGQKEYFTLSLTTIDGEIVTSEKPYTITITISNNFKDIYQVKDNTMVPITYTKEDTTITFETTTLDSYLLVSEEVITKPEEPEKTEEQPTPTEETQNENKNHDLIMNITIAIGITIITLIIALKIMYQKKFPGK